MRAWISVFTSFWMPSGTGWTTRGSSLALMGAIGQNSSGKGSVGKDWVGEGWLGKGWVGKGWVGRD
jgi:hypothetical protein